MPASHRAPTGLPVPLVDLRVEPTAALAEALASASCALVTGHGIPERLLADLVASSRTFFDLPIREKSKVRWPGDGFWRGWQPLFQVDADRPGAVNKGLLERFEVTLEAGASHDATEPGAGFELWPADPRAFRPAFTAYYRAARSFVSEVVAAVAARFDLPGEALEAWCGEQHGNLVVNNYLSQPEPPEPGLLRQRAHTDIGGLTTVWADDAPGGLEVWLPTSRSWVPVEFPPGSLLVQAGDLLARWTNNRIRANVHRVVNPPPVLGSSSRRISVVYFHYPRLDTLVAPAPSCVSPDRPAPAPLHAGRHLLEAVERPGSRYAKTEASIAD